MDRRFEKGIDGEPLGIPADLFMDPAKYPFMEKNCRLCKTI